MAGAPFLVEAGAFLQHPNLIFSAHSVVFRTIATGLKEDFVKKSVGSNMTI
jgi:hypothetical protein